MPFIQNMNHGSVPSMFQVSSVAPSCSARKKSVLFTDFHGLRKVSR